MNDGRILLVGRDELAPGEEGAVQVEPLRPEFWSALRPGYVAPVQEGARVIGHVTIAGMLRSHLFTPKVAAFVEQAREFCGWVEHASKLSLIDRLTWSRQQLLALYSAAVEQPAVEAPSGPDERYTPSVPETWQGFGEVDTYWEVFDPYAEDAPVAGSLSDDLLDIYRDLRRGLRLWELGDDAAALCEWRFSLHSHWGDHAVDALRALRRACTR